MKENKDKLVFSSVTSEKEQIPDTNPQVAVNMAFKEEQLRQTQQIPVEEIKQAANMNQPVQENKQVITPQPLENSKIEESMPNVNVQNETLSQNIVEEKKEEKSPKQPKIRKKMRKKAKIIIFLISIITTILVIFLFIHYYINNPRIVTKRTLIKVGKEVEEIVRLDDQITLVGDNFKIESLITSKLESQKVKNELATNPEMQKYNYLINNLNNSKTTLTLQQDLKNEKVFYNRQTLVNNKLVIDDKYLIENSTTYYFVKNFFETYINDGNNNYFETITEDQNAIYNIRYLYRRILELFAESIDKDDYSVVKTTTYLNDETENVKKVSIKLDNIKIRKIMNNVLEKLKKDKTAFNILNGVIENFENFKFTTKNKFLKSKETITINIYSNGLLNSPQKIELHLTGNNKSSAISYEIDNRLLTILENNKVKYYIEYEKDNNISGTIKDKNSKKIGTFEFDNTEERIHFNIDFNDNKYDIDIDVNYKVTNRKKSSYKSEVNSNISIKEDNIILLSGNIDVESNVNTKPEIEEDINEVVFSKEITKEQKEKLNELLKTRLKKKID